MTRYQMNQVRTTAETAATAVKITFSCCGDAPTEARADARTRAASATLAGAVDCEIALSILLRRGFDFATLEFSEIGGGATWNASAEMREPCKRAAAALTAQSSDVGVEASFCKHVQARSTVSGCLPAKAGDNSSDRTEMAPQLMSIDAQRLRVAAQKT
jgi:hypothetical protein